MAMRMCSSLPVAANSAALHGLIVFSVGVSLSGKEPSMRCTSNQDLYLQAHVQHIVAYGVGNAKRWTGQAQSQPSGSLLDFTVGMESRKASISIPHSVLLHKRGW